MKTILIFLFFCIPLSGNPDRATMYLEKPEAIQPYERLATAVSQVESGGDCMVVGLHGDTGPFQIRQILLDDYNQRTGNSYKIQDCFSFEISKRIFLFYCQGSDLEVIARTWNGGGKAMNIESTKEYWNKVKTRL